MLKQESSKYRGFRTPGIRLGEEMLPQLSKLYAGRTQIFLPASHAFDLAHTLMLVERGILEKEVGRKILKCIRGMEEEGIVEARTRVGGGLHSGEHYAIRALGEEIGGQFHVGRSSGDLSSVAINWVEREKLLAAMEAINRLRRVLIELAREHTDSILPGYSFGQHAQPMTLAHLWLSWATTLARDFERHLGAFRRVNVSAAGAAIMVGSDFELDRQRTSELLGFDAPHENCADAILELTPDDILEVPMVFAQVYHSMAKWADDIIQWSTVEYDFVRVPDRFCNTSSIMMQKKNVIGPAEVKGASAEAIGCVVAAYHALKGTTGLPITERYYALETLWRVGDNLVRHLEWFCELLPALHVNKEHLFERAWRHWATATDLASLLVRERGLAWRSAHQIIGIVVRLCEERGLGPADVTPELVDEAAVLYHGEPVRITQEQIRESLDPRRFIHARTLQGGPAPAESMRQADLFEGRLGEDEGTVAAIRNQLASAAETLTRAVDELVASA
jgi:argininosuccinate lyase